MRRKEAEGGEGEKEVQERSGDIEWRKGNEKKNAKI